VVLSMMSSALGTYSGSSTSTSTGTKAVLAASGGVVTTVSGVTKDAVLAVDEPLSVDRSDEGDSYLVRLSVSVGSEDPPVAVEEPP